MQVSLVSVHNVDTLWPHIRDGLQRAVMKTGGDLETGDLWVQCRNGSAFLLIAHDGDRIAGASIWTRQTWQSGRKLRCLAMYGTRMKLWKDDMREAAIRLMRENGCTSLVSEGRCGKNGEPLWTKPYPNAKPLRILYEEIIE